MEEEEDFELQKLDEEEWDEEGEEEGGGRTVRSTSRGSE